MSEAKHTPGPWKCVTGNAEREFNQVSIRPKNWVAGLPANFAIAKVNAPGFEFGYANAHLIAAAPDLLEALQEIVGYMEAAGFDVSLDAARAAIAKAGGAA